MMSKVIAVKLSWERIAEKLCCQSSSFCSLRTKWRQGFWHRGKLLSAQVRSDRLTFLNNGLNSFTLISTLKIASTFRRSGRSENILWTWGRCCPSDITPISTVEILAVRFLIRLERKRIYIDAKALQAMIWKIIASATISAAIIINMDYVQSMKSDDFILRNGVAIPIIQRRRRESKLKYMNYLLHRKDF